jgi:hypothetical protein
MKKNDYIDINYRKESKFNKTDIFEIDILGREVKFIEKEKSEAQLIPIKRRRGPRAAQHPSSLPQNDLSLWLKADAGVSKLSYPYVSEIIITGTSTPDLNGTYTAIGIPMWDIGENRPQSYSFSGPTEKTISWDGGTALFTATSEAGAGSFSSSDGASWSPNTIISEFVITGFTGIYSGANGTYTYVEEGYYTRNGGGYYVQGTELYEANNEIVIATNNNNYQGAWAPSTYFSTLELTGAGDSQADGVYTRTDSSVDMFGIGFSASGGRSILYDDNDGFWFTDGDLYRNYSSSFNDAWQTENGEEPVPDADYSNTNRNVGSPTSTTTIVPTGSISGSITTTIENSNNVLTWADQSGNGKNASYNGGLPVFSIIDSKAFLSFDPYVNMVVPIVWNAVQFVGTIFVVARFASSSSGGTAILLFQEGDSGNFVFSRGYNSTNALAVTTDEIDVVSSLTDVDNNTNYILGTTFNESLVATVYLNGISSGTGNVTNNMGTYNTLIGGGPESSNIAEMIVYTRALTDAERLQVETYLNQKYQIY